MKKAKKAMLARAIFAPLRRRKASLIYPFGKTAIDCAQLAVVNSSCCPSCSLFCPHARCFVNLAGELRVRSFAL